VALISITTVQEFTRVYSKLILLKLSPKKYTAYSISLFNVMLSERSLLRATIGKKL